MILSSRLMAAYDEHQLSIKVDTATNVYEDVVEEQMLVMSREPMIRQPKQVYQMHCQQSLHFQKLSHVLSVLKERDWFEDI